MKKATKLSAILLALAMLLAACGGDGSSDTPAAQPTGEPAAETTGNEEAPVPSGDGELMVSVWAGPHADLQKQVSADFTGAAITIDDVDYGNLKQQQLTSFAASSGTGNYDVVWVNSQWMEEYVDAGYILPIDDYIDDLGVDTSIYAKGLLDDCEFGGQLYGLPTFAQCLILCYDAEALEEHNQPVPTNVEELIDVAAYFKSQGSGIAIQAKQGSAKTYFSQLLYSDGGDYFDANGNYDMTSDEMLYAADVYQRLVQNSVDGSLAWHHDEVAEALRTKVAPIGLLMSGLANQNADPELSLITETVGYAPLAGGSGNAAAANTFWVWAVAANASDPAAAAEYCAWMTSYDVEKRQTMADQQISAIIELGEDPEVLEIAPFLPVVMEQLNNGKSDPQDASFNAFKELLEVALSEIASTNADPAEVLERLQAEVDAQQ